jgi:hypothetical protein
MRRWDLITMLGTAVVAWIAGSRARQPMRGME